MTGSPIEINHLTGRMHRPHLTKKEATEIAEIKEYEKNFAYLAQTNQWKGYKDNEETKSI